MRRVVALSVVSLVAGCTGPPERTPIPESLADEAQIPGIPLARTWADEPPPYADRFLGFSEEKLQERFPAVYDKPHNYLAVSGGGARGAFGAGLLIGWTESGTRPEFSYVTGVSTGALIAPFAFLGPKYDHVLEEIYTQYSTKDLVKERNAFQIAFGDAALDSTRFREQIALVMTEEVMAEIAHEFERGRGLQIVTTNLDASRPVAWNIGRIAASGSPRALELIRDVMLASASIPAAFPPVMFEVEAGGQRYDELHVDGGATSVVFLYPLGMNWDALLDRLQARGRPDVYVIRNGFLKERWGTVNRSLISIAGHTIDTLMGAVVFGDMYRIYLATRRDGLDYQLAYIPDSFDHEEKEPFDREYMRALFALGRELGREGYEWSDSPPGYETEEAPFLEPEQGAFEGLESTE